MHLFQQIYKQSVTDCSSSGHGYLATTLLLQPCPQLSLTLEGPIAFSRHSLKESVIACSSLVSKTFSNFQSSPLQGLQLCPLSAESKHERTLHPWSLFFKTLLNSVAQGLGFPSKRFYYKLYRFCL